ncbi:MAG: hypothetical protein A3F31_00950 [Candidatus Levybacteria bacterium RIFCSPHIGHO2_12_FULL_38_12]|nr:MAG: hypothetical protein A2770_01580 [Candidatus Levybacteria bacterium RIFCSPHIGHO2_01_FULL_38_12]OGH21988.1 MAG: hypothetical protein A3D75_03110 [Candidatus Levybacteria bacterium RIFCSPHIGHO2_02_FULL_37_18]OGH23059.1 MAG: hypothetical protein A3F31_00950 [Candidatus Levybacteria bacterium RIFCSPHIGHO2_12_FULL_38_12]OGH33681.1 MAG: hypothetical protein A3A47_02545 [Candidatus Levybacteria bacterium RIFCSPLOWO2_01_FULL_37_20]OGH44587.1 MAG: hypothetical protein A3J14_00630 [Candidatus Lev
MADAAQIILLIVISVLTILLAILGVQVFLILRELRRTVKKANKILDDAGVISQTVSSPLSSLFSFSALSEGVKVGNLLARFFKRKAGKSKHE